MASPKKFFFIAGALLAIALGFTPEAIFASKSAYFDFGPYYNQPQVLGFSFSSLENLPAPKIPDNLIPPKATGVIPGNPFYPLEQAVENVQLTFTFDPIKKEELRLEFAQERLTEAKTLMDEGKTEAASSALNNYGKTLISVSQVLSSLGEKNSPAASQLADKVEKVVSGQAVLAQNLSLTAKPLEAEYWSAASKAGLKVLDEVAESKGEPALPDELSTGIQKFKEQGLISEEESNKLYSLDSRSEVRSELDKLSSSGQFPPSELIKLDTAVARNYPQVWETMTANLQVAELKTYQTLPQPSEEVLEEMKNWQKNPAIPPPNDIKPYLWHTRAQDLAKEVDLSNFSNDQQSEVAKLYPKAVVDNPTYIAPSPSPSPSPTVNALPTAGPPSSPTPASSVSPTPAPKTAQPYLSEEVGALPGSRTYFIKRLGEQLRSTFAFDPAEKVRLKMQEAERRLAEALALSSDPKRVSQYEETVKNYRQTMSDASSYLKDSKDSGKVWEAAEKLEAQAARHEAVLEKGLLPPLKDPKLITEAIKATEDALDRSADVQGRSALPPLLSQRLGDLKAQGLILPEEAEDLVRSNSREEVREKIRKLTDLGAFPLADAKKLDEAQILTSPSDYNQLVEVRKVEELQKLRSVQSEFAQTPAFKAAATTLTQRESALSSSIDPRLIKLEDLGGREDLVKTYQKLAVVARPINGGQFGPEATPGAQITITPPRPADAVLSTCPEGAVFKQFEGCVWADSGKSLNDYDQYKCDGPRQYYSFAVRKCVAYDSSKGWSNEDVQPICPVGYSWSWQTQSCQAFTGGGTLPLPTPKPEPTPKDEREIEERSKTCPEGSSYKVPQGCIWDKDGKPVYDSTQYRCPARQYYSFEDQKCVSAPKEGETYPKDTTPTCKESGTYWSWTEGKCVVAVEVILAKVQDDSIPKPSFATPGNFLYPLKQFGETVQLAVAFTPESKQEVRASQARERLAEGYQALEKGDKAAFNKALSGYSSKMQEMFNDLSQSSISPDAKKAIGEKLAKEAVEHNLIIQKIDVVATSDQAAALSAASSAVILGVDKAVDLAGEPAIPSEVKAKVEALPEQMISEEDKKKLLEAGSRVEIRLKLGDLVAKGGLTQSDAAFLNEDFNAVDEGTKWKLEELKKLEEIATIADQKKGLEERVEKNESIVEKLTEFQKNFEPGKEISAEIRPYVRLTRIEEVAQTIRPDIVKLEDFQNRKDVILAVAALQEEFRPTREAIQKVEDFRRRNPNTVLPPEFARTEALSFSLGVRNQAGPCYLPTPPFPAGTPCPPPGAAIPVVSYAISGPGYGSTSSGSWYGAGYGGVSPQGTGAPSVPTTDKDGKPLVYGQGPKPASVGVCSNGYHWMYDSGGWCMSNSGNYSSSSYATGGYTPSGPSTPGYTPYSPYYSAPGAYPAAASYPVGDNSPNDGCPYGYDWDGSGNCIRNSYPPSYQYSPPSYYGTAPTYYTNNPPAGTVPGSGPQPTSPGKCPTGFHWMSDSGGWCMADGNTYVPGGPPSSSYPSGTTTSETPPPGGYNCGGQPYDPITKRCKDGACPGGFNWDGSKCVAGGTYYSPNLTQSSCGPGYYWDGRGCIPTYSGGGTSYGSCPSGQYWNGSFCQPSGSSPTGPCSAPYAGCGYNSYWDYGNCSCRSASSYSGGSGPSPSNYCQGLSCGGGSYPDYSTCSCKYSGSSGTTYSSGYNTSTGSCTQRTCGSNEWFDWATCSCRPSGNTYTPPSGSSCIQPSTPCPTNSWFDSGTCTCRSSSSSGNTYTPPSGSSCIQPSTPCPTNSWFDSGTCTCRSSSSSDTSSGSSGSSSGSCPSGYHWMSDNGGWCMADGAGGSTSTTTSTPPPSSEPPPPTSTTTSSPPPTESAPPPSTSTESTPPPSP